MGTLDMPGLLFVQDLDKTITIPSFCFLIVHDGDPYMFDLGMRKVRDRTTD